MIIEFQPRPILFFDGVCNLCNRTVLFVIRHDRKKQFLFSTLDSIAGKKASEQVAARNGKRDSIILTYRGKIYTRSTAALQTLKLMGGAWQLLFAFIIVPPLIRDAIYDLVARNRYKWFGRRNECMIPTPELAARFITE